MYPSNFLYTDDHEWVLVEEDSCVLGITEFAAKELGEVVFVELPEVGDSFGTGDEFGSIESVKAVAEVFTPAGGEVLAINTEIEDSPELVNEDPHGKGWLVRLRLADSDALAKLMNAEAYAAFVDGKE